MADRPIGAIRPGARQRDITHEGGRAPADVTPPGVVAVVHVPARGAGWPS